MPYLTPILLLGYLLVILSLFACIFWFGGLVIPLFFGGAPYVPSAKKRVETMMRLARLRNTDHVVDMGSGDGTLLFAAIKAGAATAEGYEVHPVLTALSRCRAKRKELGERVCVHQRSYWKADLSGTDVVLLYQIPGSMQRLGEKLKRELPSGARVVSNAFTFPDWEPSEEDHHVYLYKT